MTKSNKLNVFPLKDADEFENFCLALWKRILNDPHTQLNGRRGQRQNGVDLFGRREQEKWVGVQCKVRSVNGLTEKEVLDDVDKAKSFNPRLSELIFATTASKDVRLQTLARTLTEQNSKEGYFSVSVSSWDDILLELGEEENLDILRRFYADYFVNYEQLGIAISRIVRLSIGVVGQRTDTAYELMLGKIPSRGDCDDANSLAYWKGSYFVTNLSDGTWGTFPVKVFASDLEHVFQNKRDAYIIAKWLTDMKSIDDFIYGSDENPVKLISQEEFEEFLESLKD